MDYDVFNGDADGICALHQLRLHAPAANALVTGVKRDIRLLKRVQAEAGDMLTVLDISMDANREALIALLDAGVRVRWFDHHFAGAIPEHPNLEAHIDTAAEVCTSLLVDAFIGGRYRPWAVVAAFGDNLHASARRAAAPLGLDAAALARLERLGTLLNYNGYGVEIEDLFFHPADLYRAVHPFADPFAFIAESPAYRTLAEGFDADMARAEALVPEQAWEGGAVFFLPDAAWARRVSGVLGNRLAREHPARAHALLSPLADGGWRVSVRAPLDARDGADELCRAFPTGGGRKAAAGINALPAGMLNDFLQAFRRRYAKAAGAS
ncbi:MAG: acetyltransferase [Mariprofundaceae bacterium]